MSFPTGHPQAYERYMHARRFERAAIRMDSMRLIAFGAYDDFTMVVLRRELQAIVDEFLLKGRAKTAASGL
jgi:hypothetical protein